MVNMDIVEHCFLDLRFRHKDLETNIDVQRPKNSGMPKLPRKHQSRKHPFGKFGTNIDIFRSWISWGITRE